MPTPPAVPKIYHIVHVDRLASIVAEGGLLSDMQMSQRLDRGTTIGMSEIKGRRMRLPVHCHPGSCVAEYVPVYFCSRSLMLYVVHKANHPELAYRGGQEPIVHLEADLHETIAWAQAAGRRWAFSLSNAGARYTQFCGDPAQLQEVNWPAVESRDFRSSEVKEGKQAEFLMHGSFPWTLVARIGAHSRTIAVRATQAMAGATHRPSVHVMPDWYY